MNHSFQAAKWSTTACSICARSESLHGDSVQCESCSNVGPIEIIDKIIMCADCQLRHQNTQVAVPNEIVDKLSIEQVLNQVNRIMETNSIQNPDGDSVKSILDDAIKGSIKEYKDFFNAKMPGIDELKSIIDADESVTTENKHYALAIALRGRINYLARVLFATRNSQIEIGSEMKSIQFYMSDLIPQLRMKLRAEFAQNTPNYTPQVIHKPKSTRTKAASNPQERIAESYAKAMKIPIEQARKLIANKMRDDCTCSETPGLCKVHNNIKELKK